MPEISPAAVVRGQLELGLISRHPGVGSFFMRCLPGLLDQEGVYTTYMAAQGSKEEEEEAARPS